MNAAIEQERREVVYSGLVQGVGFRYTARHIAQKYAVVGYVQNLPNGDVRLVVEGSTAELDRFLGSIAARMQENIRTANVRNHPPTGEFAYFEIRH